MYYTLSCLSFHKWLLALIYRFSETKYTLQPLIRHSTLFFRQTQIQSVCMPLITSEMLKRSSWYIILGNLAKNCQTISPLMKIRWTCWTLHMKTFLHVSPEYIEPTHNPTRKTEGLQLHCTEKRFVFCTVPIKYNYKASLFSITTITIYSSNRTATEHDHIVSVLLEITRFTLFIP